MADMMIIMADNQRAMVENRRNIGIMTSTINKAALTTEENARLMDAQILGTTSAITNHGKAPADHLTVAPHLADVSVDVPLQGEGRVLQPHTDGVLVLPVTVENASTINATQVGGDKQASLFYDTEDTAATTAPNNQHMTLPPQVAPTRMLTRHRHKLLTIAATTLQHWLCHHSHRRRCIQQNKDRLQSLTAQANLAATTIQHWLLRHLSFSSSPTPILQQVETTSQQGYLSSPSFTRHTPRSTKAYLEDGILPTVNSLHTTALPPPQPPPTESDNNASPKPPPTESDNDAFSIFSFAELSLFGSSDSGSFSTSCASSDY